MPCAIIGALAGESIVADGQYATASGPGSSSAQILMMASAAQRRSRCREDVLCQGEAAAAAIGDGASGWGRAR